MRHFRKDEYIKLGRWVCPTLAWVPWLYWTKGPTLSKMDLPDNGEYMAFDGYGFLYKDAVEKIQKRVKVETEEENYKFFDIWFSEARNIIKEERRFHRKTPPSIKKKIEVFSDYMNWYGGLAQNWQLVFIIEEVVQDFIERKAAEADIAISDVSSYLRPIKPTLIMQERASLRLIQKKEKTGKDIAKDVKQHLSKYEWMGTHHFWGEPLTEEKIREEISKNLPDKPEFKRLPKSYPLALRRAAELIEKIIWLRNYSAEIAAVSSFKLRPLMADIAKERGLIYEELIWLTTEEILQNLPTKESLKRINDRRKKFGIYLEGDKVVVCSGKEVDVALKELLEAIDNISNITEITGKIGNKGNVRGIVRIMISPENTDLFNEGEILVAPETTPDYITLMKKAAAFVTEQGGITSHAAIVAREMGKPCIIGTKIATKVLKDGDLVEVDANKGIVKILKNYEV